MTDIRKKNSQHILLMGVSGTGKTTIGDLLNERLGLVYMDADDFHPKANVEKMKNGMPLQDEDRWPWLDKIIEAMQEKEDQGFILGCSALKKSYRTYLQNGLEAPLQVVFLKGSFDLLKERLSDRKDHFFDPSLLKSQFDTLEIPEDALTINVKETPEEIVAQIIDYLKK